MFKVESYKHLAPLVVRLGLGLVFLWFGFTQLFDGDTFLGYLPDFATKIIPLAPLTIISLNGAFDAIFGFLLLIGLFTRFTAAIVSLHLLIVALGLGYNDVAVRDLGLMLMTFSVFINGPDQWTVDVRILEKMKSSVKGAGGSLGDALGIKIKIK